MTIENETIDPIDAIGELREALTRNRASRESLPDRFSPLLEEIANERAGRQAVEADNVRLKAMISEMEHRNEQLAVANASLDRENRTMAMAMRVAVRELEASDTAFGESVDDVIRSIREQAAPTRSIEKLVDEAETARQASERAREQIARSLPELERAISQTAATVESDEAEAPALAA